MAYGAFVFTGSLFTTASGENKKKHFTEACIQYLEENTEFKWILEAHLSIDESSTSRVWFRTNVYSDYLKVYEFLKGIFNQEIVWAHLKILRTD